jgi:hypothetical protein
MRKTIITIHSIHSFDRRIQAQFDPQSVVKPPGTSVSTMAQVTAVTLALGGPCHNHSHKASTAAGSPHAKTSTRPSGKLRAFPVTPNCRARCWAAAR